MEITREVLQQIHDESLRKTRIIYHPRWVRTYMDLAAAAAALDALMAVTEDKKELVD